MASFNFEKRKLVLLFVLGRCWALVDSTIAGHRDCKHIRENLQALLLLNDWSVPCSLVPALP
jgi:hypothetical protein